MKKYLMLKEIGNEYSCSCCRRTWEDQEEMEFENSEKALEYINEFNSKFNRHDHDIRIEGCYEIGEQIYGN